MAKKRIGRHLRTSYLKLDPDSVKIEDDFSGDVREIGAGNLELTVRISADLLMM